MGGWYWKRKWKLLWYNGVKKGLSNNSREFVSETTLEPPKSSSSLIWASSRSYACLGSGIKAPE